LPEIANPAEFANTAGIADMFWGYIFRAAGYLETTHQTAEAFTNGSARNEKVLPSRADISPVRTTHV